MSTSDPKLRIGGRLRGRKAPAQLLRSGVIACATGGSAQRDGAGAPRLFVGALPASAHAARQTRCSSLFRLDPPAICASTSSNFSRFSAIRTWSMFASRPDRASS